MIPINIVGRGLRPGEELYEELLIASRDIEKTENNRISVERQSAITPEELEMRLTVLYTALEKNAPSVIRSALHQVVPTFYKPEELNRDKEGKSISPVNRAGKYCLLSSESGRRHGKTDYNRTSVFQWRVYHPLTLPYCMDEYALALLAAVAAAWFFCRCRHGEIPGVLCLASSMALY